jgi:hypothetical protein
LQGGKDLYSCFRRRWCLAALAATFVFSASRGMCSSIDSHAWIRARGHTKYPAENLDIVQGFRKKRYIGVFSTVTNPYSLSDLLSSSITIGIHSPVRAFWVDWSLVHHPIYREDRFALVYGQRFLLDCFYLAASPSVHTLRVGGLSRERIAALSASAILKGGSRFCIGVEYGTGTHRGRITPWFVLRLSFRHECVNIALNRTIRKDDGNTLRAGLEVMVTRSFSLLSGYRPDTGEIFGGCTIEKDALLFGFAWSDHPALGKTYSLGIGRMWFR